MFGLFKKTEAVPLSAHTCGICKARVELSTIAKGRGFACEGCFQRAYRDNPATLWLPLCERFPADMGRYIERLRSGDTEQSLMEVVDAAYREAIQIEMQALDAAKSGDLAARMGLNSRAAALRRQADVLLETAPRLRGVA